MLTYLLFRQELYFFVQLKNAQKLNRRPIKKKFKYIKNKNNIVDRPR